MADYNREKTVSILIIYRPPYLGGDAYTGFKLVEEFGDFLEEILNNIDMIVGGFHVEDVKGGESLAFQDLL